MPFNHMKWLTSFLRLTLLFRYSVNYRSRNRPDWKVLGLSRNARLTGRLARVFHRLAPSRHLFIPFRIGIFFRPSLDAPRTHQILPINSQRSNAKNYVTFGLSEPWSLNQFKSLRARSSYENDAQHVPANQISRRQNLCVTVTSFPTHTQRKKLTFSETALSFAVKVKLSTSVCIFLCKIMAGTAYASCVWPLWDP